MPTLIKYRMTAPPDIFDRPGHAPEQAYVLMTAEHLDDNSRIEYEGPEKLVREIEHRLLRSYGFRGRLMEEWVTPRDLVCAMHCRLMLDYKPELISGQELFDAAKG